MLVDNQEVLEKIFSECKTIIAIHSENDNIIKTNLESFKAIYGDEIPVKFHPKIRSEEACYDASSRAVALVKKAWHKTPHPSYQHCKRIGVV
jgi:dihydroorotase